MNSETQRIEMLENALEGLLECFEREGTDRPWIEVEVAGYEDAGDNDLKSALIITVGQVNQTTADIIKYAETVLYDDDGLFDAEDQ